jgi:hypothetical protein
MTQSQAVASGGPGGRRRGTVLTRGAGISGPGGFVVELTDSYS